MVIIDNGHGIDTLGKRSPDGEIQEWAYTRRVAKAVYDELKCKGYDAYLLVPGDEDVKLSQRTKLANELYDQSSKDAVLVSIHLNASGNDGQWHTGSGWAAYVSQNASQKSKDFATYIANAAEERNLKIRVQNAGIAYWVQNLAICRDTKCPAVLTENLFMDNKDDAEYLLSDKGFQSIVDLHVNGIINYINK